MEKKRGIDSFVLKLIAVISMTVDHIGAVVFPEVLLLRIIGRLAFPIYCFLLVEGYAHTKNVKKYILRMAAFALISEIPFDLAFYGTPVYMGHQNVFFTLAAGLAAICAIDRNSTAVSRSESYGKGGSASGLIYGAVVSVCFLFVYLFRTDYSFAGVLLIILFYMFRKNMLMLSVSSAIVNILLFQGGIQAYAIFSMLPIALYNGEKGRSMKYAFYLFYPVHLAVLAVVRIYGNF